MDGREGPSSGSTTCSAAFASAPGTHTIELAYEPLSFRVGWIVSLLGLLGLAVTLAVGLRARRRGATGP